MNRPLISNEREVSSLNRRYTLCIIILVSFACVPFHVDARVPFEDILAHFGDDQIGFDIQGNLTYDTEKWYYDDVKNVSFSLTATIPDNASVSIQISRFAIYLDFSEDGPFLYQCVNRTYSITENLIESGDVFQIYETVNVSSSNLGFIIDDPDLAYLGFLVEFNSSFHSESGWTNHTNLRLFSRQPSGHSWNVNPYPRFDDNNDRFWIYEMYTFNPISTDFFGLLYQLAPLFLIIFGSIIGLAISAGKYSNWRESKPESYIKKKRWVGGTHYTLGGLPNALLFTLNNVLGDKEPRFNEDLKQWAGIALGIDLLDETNLGDKESRLWNEIYDGINRNAGGLYQYLIDRFPFGDRVEPFMTLCRKESIDLTVTETTLLYENLEDEIENVRTRWRDERNPYRKISEILETVSRIDEKLPEGTVENLVSLLSADVEVGKKIEAVGVSLGLSETDIIHLLDKIRTEKESLTKLDIRDAVREVLDEIDLNQNLGRFYDADPVKIEEFLTRVLDASTNKEKGESLESLCEYVFGSINGFQVQRNVRAKIGEIDLFISNNHTRVPFLRSLGERFIVEAKNWNEKVGVDVVDKLVGQMTKYHIQFSILATKHGITGNDSRDAKRTILKVRSSGHEIIVIGLDDFRQLAKGKNLIELLIKKRNEKILE